MKHISTYCNALASSTLFRYNRGLMTLKTTSSYSEVITMAKNPKFGGGYENEGINYVYRIFKLLYENFGYRQLNMAVDKKGNPVVPFDAFNATLG